MAGQLLSGDALDASSLAVSIRDLDGVFLRVNGPFAALVGLDVEELRGSTTETLFPGDIAEALRLHDGLALSSPGVVSLEEWVVDRVGRRRVATSRFAMRDPDGRVSAVCCVSSAAGHERLVRLECDRLFELDGGIVATTDPDAAAALAAGEQERHALAARLAEVETARAELLEELAAADAGRADAQERLNTSEQRLVEATAALAEATAAHADATAAHAALAEHAAASDAARTAAEHQLTAARADLEQRLAAQAAAALDAIRRADERQAEVEAAIAERDAAVAALTLASETTAERERLLAEPEAQARTERRPAEADGVVPALRALAQTLAGAEDFEAAVRDAVGPLGHDLGWDAAFIWRQERPDAPLTCIAGWTDPDLDLARFETASWKSAVARGPLADAFEDAQAAWITDVGQRQDLPRLRDALAAGLSSSALAPIVGPDGVDGVLEVLARETRPVDPRRLDAVRTAGAMLGDLGHLLARVSQPRWSAGRH